MKKLDMLVKSLLSDKITSKESFSAYDITKEIRRDNPGLDVPHEFVRNIVHEQMEDPVEFGLYNRVDNGTYQEYVSVEDAEFGDEPNTDMRQGVVIYSVALGV